MPEKITTRSGYEYVFFGIGSGTYCSCLKIAFERVENKYKFKLYRHPIIKKTPLVNFLERIGS